MRLVSFITTAPRSSCIVPDKPLLLFGFLAQLLLGKLIEHVFRSEQTVIVMQNEVTGDLFVRLRAEDDTDGRILAYLRIISFSSSRCIRIFNFSRILSRK